MYLLFVGKDGLNCAERLNLLFISSLGCRGQIETYKSFITDLDDRGLESLKVRTLKDKFGFI